VSAVGAKASALKAKKPLDSCFVDPSALLTVSGLLVQRMCRLDEDQRDQRDDEDELSG